MNSDEANLPEVAGPTLYTRALSASRVAVDVEGAVGPLVAGALTATVGVRWTFWFDAGTYLLSALLLYFAEAAAGAVVIATTIVYVRDALGRGDGRDHA